MWLRPVGGSRLRPCSVAPYLEKKFLVLVVGRGREGALNDFALDCNKFMESNSKLQTSSTTIAIGLSPCDLQKRSCMRIAHSLIPRQSFREDCRRPFEVMASEIYFRRSTGKCNMVGQSLTEFGT